MLVLRWVNLHFVLEKDHVTNSGFSYEMASLETEAGRFDLAGRAIDRHVLEDPAVTKKIASATKPAEVKKAASGPAAATKAAETLLGSKRLASFQSTVVDTSRKLGLSASGSYSLESTTPAGGAVVTPAAPKASTVPTKSNSNGNSDTNVKSASDYRAEFFGGASQSALTALAQQFVQAHQAGDIKDLDFYSISFDLLLSGNPAQAATGQLILSEDNSPSSFSNLALEYSKVAPSQRQIVWSLMLGYADVRKFSSLSAGLENPTQGVRTLALQVLAVAVQKAQASVTSNSGVSTLSTGKSSQAQGLLVFLPALNDTVKSDPQDSVTAEGLIAQIQSLNS